MHHHRPVREQGRTVTLAKGRAPSEDGRTVELDTARRRADREPHRDALVCVLHGPAQQRSRLLCVRRLDDRDVRQSTEQRDVAHALVRLARAGGDQARVVKRIHDLRPFAGLVVDLLVGARGEKARERVHNGQKPLTCKACGHRDHVLLRDPDLDESRRLLELDTADTAVRREIRIEHDELRMLSDQPQQLFAVGRGNVLIRDRRAAHSGAGLRLALERNALVERRHRLELHLGQTHDGCAPRARRERA